MPPQHPQLKLRFDAAPPAATQTPPPDDTVVWLGERLKLVIDPATRVAQRCGTQLHLPLPPAATPRQIRDAAESWLRGEALRLFASCVAEKSALAGRTVPSVVLAFGKRADWVCRVGDRLRCHWRLIEQPLPVIEQVLARALTQSAAPAASCDLFAKH